MKLNPFNLSFTAEHRHLEKDFLDEYNSQSVKYIRFAFVIGIMFYSIFGLLDALLIPEKKFILWFIRFGVVCPVMIIFILLSFWSGFKKWTQTVIVFVMLLAGSGISVMVAIIPPPATFSYYAGVILVLMLGYGFVKARFIWASLGGWINVLIYEIVAIFIVDTPNTILINNNFFFISANVIGMLSCYAMEFYTRKTFFMARMLSKEQKKVIELNEGLEKKVTERTYQLQKAYDTLKKEMKDREELQKQLDHVQKMESVGRLAGGVAHDFNNILSIIIGYCELALDQVKPGELLHEELEAILAAAERSSEITRQLLAFARKDTISPVVLELNSSIGKMLKVTRRLIGEDINLKFVSHNELIPVLMDRSQLEQVITNLCVNARDAISGVGEISIETSISFIKEPPAKNIDFIPGEYVKLLVRDTGKGMDKNTVAKIFEPFFTTKNIGEGTGLGLSSVHGIIIQNNGFINVLSNLNKGTTFEIYLPKHEAIISVEDHKVDKTNLFGNGETILLVEDEIEIIKLARQILLKNGYKVITARAPFEAIEFAKEHSDQIDLLITDVIMPQMNGKELSDKINKINSSIKSIFISGYTSNIIAQRGVLEKNINFIQKPFSTKQLTDKVRAVLDNPEY